MTKFINVFVATDTLNISVLVFLLFTCLLYMSWYYTHDGTNNIEYLCMLRIILVCIKYLLNFLTIVFYWV